MFEAHRRVILSVKMIEVRGRVQRENEVMHHVVHTITDIFSALSSVGDRTAPFPLPNGRGYEFYLGPLIPGPTQHANSFRTRDMYVRDLHLDTIKAETRDSR